MDKVDAMFVKSATAVGFLVISMRVYHQTDLSMRVEQIDDPNIPLHSATLSCSSFCNHAWALTVPKIGVAQYQCPFIPR